MLVFFICVNGGTAPVSFGSIMSKIDEATNRNSKNQGIKQKVKGQLIMVKNIKEYLNAYTSDLVRKVVQSHWVSLKKQ